jgi:hypothetical protein
VHRTEHDDARRERGAGLHTTPAGRQALRLRHPERPERQRQGERASASRTATSSSRSSRAGSGIGCEGRRLCGTLSFRGTTDRCVDGESCTVIDLIDWVADSPTGCCVVQSGFCKLRTTVNAIRFDTVSPGDRAGVELMGCGLRRMDGSQPSVLRPAAGTLRSVCGPLAGPLGP